MRLIILFTLLVGSGLLYLLSFCSIDHFYRKYNMQQKDALQYLHGKKDLFAIIFRADRNFFIGEFQGTYINRIWCSLALLMLGGKVCETSYRHIVDNNDYYIGTLGMISGIMMLLMIFFGWNYGRDMKSKARKAKHPE